MQGLSSNGVVGTDAGFTYLIPKGCIAVLSVVSKFKTITMPSNPEDYSEYCNSSAEIKAAPSLHHHCTITAPPSLYPSMQAACNGIIGFRHISRHLLHLSTSLNISRHLLYLLAQAIHPCIVRYVAEHYYGLCRCWLFDVYTAVRHCITTCTITAPSP